MPPLGYFTRGATGGARDVIIDEERSPYIRKMFEMSADGKSGRHLKRWLEDNGLKTRTGKNIPLSMIYRILSTEFYYGEFEYPRGSGQWYKGNHEPIITKELFQKVREQAKVPIKSKWGAKQFPYKQFLSCYTCGASVVGEEKIRRYKNGKIQRFVYYHCSKQVDNTCPEPFVREKDITAELLEMRHELIADLSHVEPGMQDAIDKFSRMMRATHKSYGNKNLIGGYIQYVLLEGSDFEKTRLVRNLDIKLALNNRKLIRNEN